MIVASIGACVVPHEEILFNPIMSEPNLLSKSRINQDVAREVKDRLGEGYDVSVTSKDTNLQGWERFCKRVFKITKSSSFLFRLKAILAHHLTVSEEPKIDDFLFTGRNKSALKDILARRGTVTVEVPADWAYISIT